MTESVRLAIKVVRDGNTDSLICETRYKEPIIMGVIKNFDMDALRKERARKAASGGVDLVAGLKEISPEIETLKVGETAQVEIPGKTLDEKKANLRKTVMSITAKIGNLTCQGGEWEGKSFDTVSDGEKYIYVQRGNNLKGDDIPVRRRGGGGGRKAKAKPDTKGTTTVEDGATVTEHA